MAEEKFLPAKTDFTENQLSPCLIGLSPLTVTYLRVLQHPPVGSLENFHNLFTVRSHGFGYYKGNYVFFRYALACYLYKLANPLYKRYGVSPELV